MIRECFPTSVLLGSIERPVEPQVVLDDDVDDNDYYNDDDDMINMVVMKDWSQFVSMITEINDNIQATCSPVSVESDTAISACICTTDFCRFHHIVLTTGFVI